MTTGSNDRLRALRSVTPSPKRPGECMSRAELAEAVNAHVWETSGRRVCLDAEAVGRYERGLIQWPGSQYRGALRAIFGVESDEALGFRPTPRGRSRPVRSSRSDDIDDRVSWKASDLLASEGIGLTEADRKGMESFAGDLVAGFGTVLGTLAAADAAAGPLLVLASARAQSELIATLARATSGSDRRVALPVAARFAEFTGWLFQDSGDIGQASRWTDQALGHALELGAPQLMSYVLMRKANIAADAQDYAQSLGLAEAALRTSGTLAPRLQAVALRQKALASAQLGDGDGSACSLDRAREMVDDAGGNGLDPFAEELVPYCGPSYIEMEAATCWVHLGKPDQAIPVFERSLRRWPADEQTRDRALCLARLATAHALSGNFDAAAATGLDAVEAHTRTRSARTYKQLMAMRAVAAPGLDSASMSDFNDRFNAMEAGVSVSGDR